MGPMNDTNFVLIRVFRQKVSCSILGESTTQARPRCWDGAAAAAAIFARASHRHHISHRLNKRHLPACDVTTLTLGHVYIPRKAPERQLMSCRLWYCEHHMYISVHFYSICA